jgi:undecaprenyl-diphosphatase
MSIHAPARGPLPSLFKPEGTVLLIVLVVVGGIWGFVEIASRVTSGSTLEFDREVVRAMRRESDPAVPIGPAWLAVAARDVTSLGGTAVITLAVAAIALYLVFIRKRHAVVLLAVAIAGGAAVDLALKGSFQRERPDVVPHLDTVASSSFPSGHSMLSAIVYLTLGALVARVTPGRLVKLYVISVAVAATLLVGVTRVYLGVHYPTDVLAGWTAGLVWALLCELLARWLQARGSVES